MILVFTLIKCSDLLCNFSCNLKVYNRENDFVAESWYTLKSDLYSSTFQNYTISYWHFSVAVSKSTVWFLKSYGTIQFSLGKSVICCLNKLGFLILNIFINHWHSVIDQECKPTKVGGVIVTVQKGHNRGTYTKWVI